MVKLSWQHWRPEFFRANRDQQHPISKNLGNTGGKDDSDEFMSGAGLFSDYSELKEDYDDDLDASLKEETKKAAKDHADISCEASVFAEKLPDKESQATKTAAAKTVTGLATDL